MIPPQAQCTESPGTIAWAQWQLQHVFDVQDARAITDAVAVGLVPFPSISGARVHYARLVQERRWPGWQARLAWAVIEALMAEALEDAIPF